MLSFENAEVEMPIICLMGDIKLEVIYLEESLKWP